MVTELGGSVFEITHDLVGDLFRAKNVGVTAGLQFFLIFFNISKMLQHFANCWQTKVDTSEKCWF
jgi:hypothetical protein